MDTVLIMEEESNVTWEMLDTNDLITTLNDIERSGLREVKFIIHHPEQPSFASTYRGEQCSHDTWTIIARAISTAAEVEPQHVIKDAA
jgi:hypothetical protein